MSFNVSLYSKLYLAEEDASWSARPNTRLLNLLHRMNDSQGSARWVAVLPSSTRIALGDPVSIPDTPDCMMFLPVWVLDSEDTHDGQEVEIRFERCEILPKATRLAFKILGDIPKDIDIKELLEEPLSQLGVLQEGQIIPAPVLENVELLVKTCEGTSDTEGPFFLDGSDIALEIEEDEPPVETPPIRPPPFYASEETQQEQQPFDTSPMVTSTASHPALTGLSTFVPFQGVGRRLCD